ncbi:hypothetical protein AWV80_00165 [Cupriavidus sp. UYMU48A]|nr:hypothetical protein AWV80_00165 [Cupriavidus sp. UYMU48A]
MNGTTFKLEQDPRPAQWMVPPLVGEAIACAEMISVPMRRRVKEILYAQHHDFDADLDVNSQAELVKTIASVEKLDECIFLRASNVGFDPLPPLNSSTNHLLKGIARSANLIVESDDLSDLIDRERIVAGAVWPLASHQFRRTFAVFVARNLLGDVRYLRHHFKHWSIDMTLHYAKDPSLDDTLFTDVLSSRDELQANLVAGWISGTQRVTGGRAAQVIRFRERNAVKTVKDARELARAVGDGILCVGLDTVGALPRTMDAVGKACMTQFVASDAGKALSTSRILLYGEGFVTSN